MAASDHVEDDRLRVSMPFASFIPMVPYTAEDDEENEDDDDDEDEVRMDEPSALSAEAIAAGVKPESYSNPPSAMVCRRVAVSAKTTGLNKKG